jgi:uncharacterized membrane protein YccC
MHSVLHSRPDNGQRLTKRTAYLIVCLFCVALAAVSA